ncbi:MAG: dicarboxylate/amino acid:cation symporter [Bacteroidales bacterium]|nr:dicarboxylate/amino acid:cation symporter [Bacteroidales bacterium]
MKLYLQIIIALVAGALTGILLPGATPYISWIGTLFMNALSLLMAPIIFFSIINSIADIRDSAGSLKRLTAKTCLLYLLSMAIAAVTGLLLVNLIRPGAGVPVAQVAMPDNISGKSFEEIITGFIPTNIITAFAQNNTVPVILIAFVGGLAFLKISGESGRTLRQFFKGGGEITMLITGAVIKASPFGVFAIVARQFSTVGDFMGLLQMMALYMLTVIAGLLIQMFVWLPLLLRFFRVKAWRHFRNMSEPLLLAFSTASSNVTLPVTMQAVQRRSGVSARVSNLTLPLGASVNMDGTALLECVAVMFIAQAYSVALTPVQQLAVVAMSLLSAVGAAGIPMAALVMMAVILNMVGLPLEGIGLIIGVDRLLDMLRTALNVYGDTCVAVMVAKSEGETLAV